MHLLIVSGVGPPSSGPVARRLAALVAAALAGGHRVTVLLPDLEAAALGDPGDGGVPAPLPEDAVVVRVSVPQGQSEPVVNRWPQQRIDDPATWASAAAARAASAFVEGPLALWRPRLEAAAYVVHRTDPVGLVVVLASPPVVTAAAVRLWSECAVPFVLDLPAAGGVPADQGESGAWLAPLLPECAAAWVFDPESWERFPAEVAGARPLLVVGDDGLAAALEQAVGAVLARGAR